VSPLTTVLALAAPWIVTPLVTLWRLRDTPSLDSVDPIPPAHPPRVSVVVPARNEAAHIAGCVASLRRSTWPNVEFIVVDDHSNDGTKALALEAANSDPRVHVIDAPPLPDGWFGKQWACHTGSQHATGEYLLFTDADTRHAPELIARLVRVRADRNADLLSVAGRQEMRTFWEWAIQPVVFTTILARFGGARTMERARRPADVVTNGQCLFMPRTAYDAVGGHVSVRDTVAEDVMLAHAMVQHRKRVSLALGQTQLSTHMYDDLSAIVRGWRKNVYAGGRFAMRGGAIGRLLYPVLLVGFPLFLAAPLLVLPLALSLHAFGVAPLFGVIAPLHLLLAAMISGTMMLGTFALGMRFVEQPMWRALAMPIGALAFAWIAADSVIRGRRVEWKGRAYVSR
jgi:glycosyltransferase involved in cell wall biosynthesis